MNSTSSKAETWYDASASAIPVVGHKVADLDPATLINLQSIATAYRRDEPALARQDLFGPHVRQGIGPGPMLLIGDTSEIPLLPDPGSAVYEYRSALLARQGDIIALSQPRNSAYEAYLTSYLGLPTFDVVVVEQSTGGPIIPMAKRLVNNKPVFKRLVSRARDADSLTIVPHLVTGSSWALASNIAATADTDVYVCGPPPRLSQRLNDKLWFADCAAKVLGRRANWTTVSAFGPAALAGIVKKLSKRWSRLVIKVPDSAGSAGNISIDTLQMRGRGMLEIRDNLMDLLVNLGWRGRFPLMVEVWDISVLSSPSVQMWITEADAGPPILEGIFEQMVEGPVGAFAGAVPAELPDRWAARLADEAGRLAWLFQMLGYFGPCSLDCIISGTSYNNANVHWIECNARWGGVSLPMTFAHRILGPYSDQRYVIVQREERIDQCWTVPDVLKALSGLLYDKRVRPEGVVLLTTTGLERGRGMHFMVVAATIDEAKTIAVEAMDRLRQPKVTAVH